MIPPFQRTAGSMSKLNGRISETTAGSSRPSRHIARLPWTRVVVFVVIALIIVGLVGRDKARIHVVVGGGIALCELYFAFHLILGECLGGRVHIFYISPECIVATGGKSGRTFPEIPVLLYEPYDCW